MSIQEITSTGNQRGLRITILGEACSKANSRRMVPGVSKAGKAFMRPIKAQKALDFIEAAQKQVPVAPVLLTGELVAHIWIWYSSERNDLDESLVLDVLQKRLYANDRQIRERHVYHGIDKQNPRVELILSPRSSLKGVLRHKITSPTVILMLLLVAIIA